MSRTPVLIVALALAAALAGAVFARTALAGSKPEVQLNVERAVPREVEDAVRQAVLRDYSSAWLAIHDALAGNTTAPLNDNFVGFALDTLTQRVKDQQRAGVTARLTDRGHKVDAIFYSPDGSAIELRDTATLETEILGGNTVIHSDTAQIQYYVVMTGAEDRWKVRVMESQLSRQ